MFKKLDFFETLTPFILVMVLLAIRLSEGYLLFHVLVELFAVIIGILISLITYYMYKFTQNKFLRFLGIGFFWTAILDLFHMLSYYGMNLYSDPISQNPSTTLWILARIFQIITLLAAPFVRFNTISPRMVFGLFAFAAIGAYTGAFMGLFPAMYIPEKGLSITKIALEYTIMFATLIAIMIYRSKREIFHPFMYQMICLSLLIGIVAEMCFTLYVDVYGVMNLLGHIFKFIAYWMIFKGVIVTALKEPFTLMAKASSTYDTIPVPVVVTDNEGTIRQINRATTQCASYTFNEFIGQDNHTLLHPPGVTKSECKICQAIDKGEYCTLELEFENKYKQYTISPIKTNDTVGGILQICIDMTAQRQAEKQSIKEGILLKTIVNSIPMRLFWKDKESVYMGCNNLFAQDAGFQDASEIIGKRDDELVWHNQAQLYRDDDQEVIQSGIAKVNFEEPQDSGEPETKWLRTSKVPLREVKNDAIVGVVGTYSDITEIRKTEQQLKENERFYKTIFSSVNKAIFIIENEKIIDCNERAGTLLEIDKESLIGSDLKNHYFDIKCTNQEFKDYFENTDCETHTKLICSLSLANKQLQKVVEIAIAPLGDINQKKFIVIMDDITKQIENDKMVRMHIKQAQMGEMISMIAHQWRQPLGIINAITSNMKVKMIMEETGDDTVFINNLNTIEEQSIYLSQTISEYRDFFRVDKPTERFRPSTLIHTMFRLTDHTLKNHSIETDIQIINDPLLVTYRNEILQVLIALLKNSLDAFEEKQTKNEKITIIVDTDETYCSISISDNAGGISDDIIEKIFLPNFTTKEKNIGTGLGLYMSKMIIQEHCNGVIEAISNAQITTFTIKLPYIKDQL
ncbi:MAG: MASE3 domain-containing protein [Sulfuricurvum sp.]|uniref:MASE3 domain-containing protein n=1 Tax=Sulfuricurvum sp. TaxID=2025608 RepID=UPI00261D5F04|nr:MASE3 domain-containing protein [Sulfuricurvum sp.]MDD2829734.1 MASE3 domain-containing protein [Sulfuricurvum sp.]MDD4949204.1 MASE3 domain-containing protein [Sulfuricurvum sp.]